MVVSLILSAVDVVMEAKLIGLGLRNRKCAIFKVAGQSLTGSDSLFIGKPEGIYPLVSGQGQLTNKISEIMG